MLDDVLSGRAHVHLLVDEQDFAVRGDVNRVASGHGQALEHAIGPRRLVAGIAENGIVKLQVLGKGEVDFGRVDAGGENRYLELLQGLGAVTQRLTLFGSAAGVGLGKPGQHHGLASIIAEAVAFAVAAGQIELRSDLADLKGSG